jgi:large subunit ribosomal protein L25
MLTDITLDVQERTALGKKVKGLRKQGVIPATIYGKNFGPYSVQMEDKTFLNVFHKVGKTILISLNMPGQEQRPAFIYDVQIHPVTRNVIHADFMVVDLTTEMTVEVNLITTGSSPLVEKGDALVNQAISRVQVRALPQHIPPHIEVDINGLDSFDKVITVADLPTDGSYTFITPGDILVVSLSQTRAAVVAQSMTGQLTPEGDMIEESSEPELIRKDSDSE